MPTVSLDPKVFINESADGNKYPSFRFQRVYKNAEGKDEYTNSFSGKDLPSLAMAASRLRITRSNCGSNSIRASRGK